MSRRPSLLSCFVPWRGVDGPQPEPGSLLDAQLNAKHACSLATTRTASCKPEAAPRAVAETTEAPSLNGEPLAEEGALDLLVLCGSAMSQSAPHSLRAPEEGCRSAHLRVVAPEDLVRDMQLGRLLGCGPTSSVHKGAVNTIYGLRFLPGQSRWGTAFLPSGGRAPLACGSCQGHAAPPCWLAGSEHLPSRVVVARGGMAMFSLACGRAVGIGLLQNANVFAGAFWPVAVLPCPRLLSVLQSLSSTGGLRQ